MTEANSGNPRLDSDTADSRARSLAADAVRARLSHRPGLIPLPIDRLEMYMIQAFLGPGECAALIGLIDANCAPSGLLADHPDEHFRTSETCNLDPLHPAVRDVELKISALIHIPPKYGEPIQGQRYSTGQQFKPHHDFFYTTEPYWAVQKQRGGQRTWTVMIFLNERLEGGRTQFPEAQVAIEPRTGTLLMWNNLDRDGYPNPMSLHQGMPVTAGRKYIVTKWYRERPWR